MTTCPTYSITIITCLCYHTVTRITINQLLLFLCYNWIKLWYSSCVSRSGVITDTERIINTTKELGIITSNGRFTLDALRYALLTHHLMAEKRLNVHARSIWRTFDGGQRRYALGKADSHACQGSSCMEKTCGHLFRSRRMMMMITTLGYLPKHHTFASLDYIRSHVSACKFLSLKSNQTTYFSYNFKIKAHIEIPMWTD